MHICPQWGLQRIEKGLRHNQTALQGGKLGERSTLHLGREYVKLGRVWRLIMTW